MKLTITTLWGLLAAISFGVSTVSGLSADALLVCHVITAAAVAALGYHAQPRDPPPAGSGRVPVAAMLCVIALMAAGCKVSSFGLSVKSPTFGSVGLTLAGGMIGKPNVCTNAPEGLAVAVHGH